MIGEVFIPCILFAAGSTAIRLLLTALGKDGLGAFCRDIAGLVILILLVTSVTGHSPPSFPTEKKDDTDYQKIYNERLQGILSDTEAQTAEKICTVVENEFGSRPDFCTVRIQADSFSFAYIHVHFKAQTVLSGYAVKKYLSETYNTKVEVFFDG